MKNKDSFTTLGICTTIGISIYYLVRKFNIRIEKINIELLVCFIIKYGKYAVVCFLILCALKPLLVFMPTTIFSIVGGILFGPIKGFILNMVGFFFSGTLAFSIARFWGQSRINSILHGRAAKVNANLEKNGFKVLFLLRLPPILPYDPLSYTCGLSKIKYRDFILASLLGVIPETICYSIMGRNILNPFSPKFIFPLVFIILSVILSTFIFKKANDF